MYFFTTSDALTMSALHRVVYLGKASYYKKIIVDLSKAPDTIPKLMHKFSVDLNGSQRGKLHDEKGLCSGHMVVQLNQQLYSKKECYIFILITLPKKIREKQSVLSDLLDKLELTEAQLKRMSPAERFSVVMDFQRKIIRSSFKELDGTSARDHFYCLHHRDERIMFYAKNGMPKVVLRLSDRSPKRLSEIKKMEELKQKNGDPVREIKSAAWTWHMTSQYKNYIQNVCIKGVQKKLAQKKIAKRKAYEATNKASPKKSQLTTWLNDAELRQAIQEGAGAIRTIPGFRGTLADLGEICLALEKRYNRQSLKSRKKNHAKANQVKRTFPIQEAFHLDQLKKEAFYSTRINFEIKSFEELLQRVEDFSRTLENAVVEQVDVKDINAEDELEKWVRSELIKKLMDLNRAMEKPKSKNEVLSEVDGKVKGILRKIKYLKY